MPDEIFYFRESDIPPSIPEIAPKIFAPLRDGLKNGLLVEIVYQGAHSEDGKRKILPEVLFRSDETWYVSAFCHVRNEPRTFRLDRIDEATLTDAGDDSHGIAQDIRDNGIPWKRNFASSEKTEPREPQKRGLWISMKLIDGEDGPEIRIESSEDGKITPKTEWDLGFDLVRHAEQGDIARMKEDLAAGADIDFISGTGQTPFTAAAGNGRLEALKFLAARGADPYRKTKKGSTALLEAAWNCRMETVRYLVEELNFDVNSRDCFGWGTLYYAILRGHREMLAYFLERGADVNDRTRKGETCLMAAAGKIFSTDEEKVDFVGTLLDHGAEVDLQDNRGRTALYYAIENNSRTCMKLLLDAGASISHRDKKGASPFLFAFMNFDDPTRRLRDRTSDWNERCHRQKELARFLIGRGATVDSSDKNGVTPLMLAHGGEVIEYLISEGAYAGAYDRNGKTTAMYHIDDIVELRLLQKHGANLTARDIDGNDLLLLAPVKYETIKTLVNEFGLSVNTKNARGVTPLHRACEESDLASIKFLIRHGADPNAEDADGRTPASIVEAKHYEAPDDWGMSDDEEIFDYICDVCDKATIDLRAACEAVDLEKMRYALEHGAAPDQTMYDKSERTATTIVARRYSDPDGGIPDARFEAALDLLRSKRADMFAFDADGNCVLCAALARKNDALFKKYMDIFCGHAADKAADSLLELLLQRICVIRERCMARNNGAVPGMLVELEKRVHKMKSSR